MVAFKDLTGQTFGRWYVHGISDKPGKQIYWNCECSCGIKRPVSGGNLAHGVTNSCGCLARERAAEAHTTHGKSKGGERHPAYISWCCARGRCNNPNSAKYPIYGGRGITFCERWDDFALFWEDMGSTWQEGLSIDRIDTNGNYEPGNCRWSTPKEQGNNKRYHRIVETYHGPMNISQAAEFYELHPETIASRLDVGDTVERALRPVTEKRGTPHLIPTPDGLMNISEAARRFCISRDRIKHRIKRGWDEADLLLP